MAFNVQGFRDKMTGDGARANLFEINITPASGDIFDNTDLNFFAKSSSIPGTTMGSVTVPYFGREVKFAGNRTYGDWTITVINDEDFTHRNQFESWINQINAPITNTRLNSLYTATGTVVQKSKEGLDLRTYSFVNIFPTDLGEITLDWGDNDSIEEYTVTFAYDYWEAD